MTFLAPTMLYLLLVIPDSASGVYPCPATATEVCLAVCQSFFSERSDGARTRHPPPHPADVVHHRSHGDDRRAVASVRLHHHDDAAGNGYSHDRCFGQYARNRSSTQSHRSGEGSGAHLCLQSNRIRCVSAWSPLAAAPPLCSRRQRIARRSWRRLIACSLNARQRLAVAFWFRSMRSLRIHYHKPPMVRHLVVSLLRHPPA